MSVAAPEKTSTATTVPNWLTALLAFGCGMIVANVYYAQPLVGPIGAELGISPQAAGLIVAMGQAGYVLGLLLAVPLGDLVENRRLIVGVMAVGTVALLAAALSTRPLPFLVAAWFIGLGSVTVQILIPYAAHLAPKASRGRVVGNVSTGLMLGVMLSRPAASFITALSSWHMVYFVATAAMLALSVVMWRALPPYVPPSPVPYRELLLSMVRLLRTSAVLRRRALYQSCLFGAFSLFWTAMPLRLAGPDFMLSQRGIALFALAGVAGAIAAPIAGRVADRGWTRAATAVAMIAVAASFLLTQITATSPTTALLVQTLAAILIDFGVQANVVLGYRSIFVLDDAYRSRLNGLYMASFYLAGAAGSALGGWAFARGGWPLASWLGFALPVAALIYFAGEKRER